MFFLLFLSAISYSEVVQTITFRADLHCHTTCSDGTMTPRELIFRAKELGLSALSITDHDTLDAYQTAIPAAKEAGILLGSGIELSCFYNGASVHLLGYDFLLSSPSILDFCKKHKKRREERNREILAKLAEHNMPIQEKELVQKAIGSSSIGRPHIAEIMCEKGFVKSIKDAFSQYIGEGKSCYASGTHFTVEETMDVIKQAGGKVFIAHPHLVEDRALLNHLLTLPFNGIECYYGKSSPEQESRWLKIAKEKHWIASGGSDFHGTLKPHIALGCSWVDETTFKQIFQHGLL